ncbi:MAG: peptidylprolyl isomerase [Bacteroidales bacterium]|nr:peptidylprolyl isomerase [Bacteroidales bacterium]
MRKTILLCIIALFPTLAIAQQAVPVDKVVAVVGKNIIKMSDIESAYAQVRLRQGNSDGFANRCDILEGMLLNRLMVQKGLIDSVEVSDEEVESQVEYYLKAYLRQYGSKEALREATGFEYDEFHDLYFDLLKNRILSQRVESQLTSSVTVTPQQVRAYYDRIPKDSLMKIEAEYEFAEITIQPAISQQERDRVRLELAQLRERVLKGEKFSMLATLYSQDPGSAKKGGELGFFGRGDMVPEFESAAFALKPGEVSPIIETQFGFHILQLIERRGNTINVRHILLQPKVSNEDLLVARIRLDSIADAIRSGSITFADAVKTYSNANTKRTGGVMVNPNTGNNRFTRSAFTELYPGIAITSMKEGDISNATLMTDEDNKSLYRIVCLTKKIDEHSANLVDDYDKIHAAALAEAKHEKVLSWSAKMIKNTYIRIDDEYKGCNFRLNWIQQ